VSPTGSTTPVGVDHVAVVVPDVPAALEFYVGQLGLTPDASRPDFPVAGAWLDTRSGQQLHLVEGEIPGHTASGLGHVALAYEDLDLVIDELRRSGLVVSDAQAVGQTGRRQALTADPWGNRVELHQRPRA
jgi:catechol 2,3-dioxygenase-like lactoylglutathione lyase family enzyme